MKILATTRRRSGATSEKIQALQGAEVAAVWAMHMDGFIREVYFDPEKPSVVLILEAASIAEARDRLATLPMVSAKLLEFEFTTLGPYRQFEHLFAGGEGAR